MQQDCNHSCDDGGGRFVLDTKFVTFNYEPSNKLIENLYFYYQFFILSFCHWNSKLRQRGGVITHTNHATGGNELVLAATRMSACFLCRAHHHTRELLQCQQAGAPRRLTVQGNFKQVRNDFALEIGSTLRDLTPRNS